MPQQQPQHQAAGLLLLLFLLWNPLPGGRDALEVLNQTRWGDFRPRPDGVEANAAADDGSSYSYVNLTGFREQDGFAWDDLELFREKGLRLSRHAIPPVGGKQLWDAAQGEPVWANASGTLHGDWVRRPGSSPRTYDSYNLSRSVPGMDWVGDRADWARNITGESGRMMLRLEGNRTVQKYDEVAEGSNPLSGGMIRHMRLWGLQWPRQGVVLMTTTSEKFEGIFGLPHLAPSADFFQSAQMMLKRKLARVVRRKRRNLYVDQNMPWNSDVDNAMYTAFPSPHCEFVLYGQVHPPLQQDAGVDAEHAEDVIRAIESELQKPLGAPIHSVSKLQMSTVIYSPDCGFFLESKGPPDFPPGDSDHLVGMKTEVHTHQVKTWMLVYALVVFAQVGLLKDQMQESFTPSTMGRVSFWTVSAMVIVDGMTFTAAATWVSSAMATFLPTLALMFASFLSMTIGGSFLAKIHEVQLPERNRRRDQQRQTSSGTSTETTSSAPSAPLTPNPTGALLPAPVTAPRSTRLPPDQGPIIIPSDQDISAEIAAAASAVPRPNMTFQAIIGRFILFSLFVSFLAISSVTWYSRPRALLLNACALAYFSLWLPQICRNTLRNCRRALSWRFVLGQSALRLLPFAYFWVKHDNFLYARTDRRAFALLCAWVWLQICLLAAQDVLGPRFGIPAGWAPRRVGLPPRPARGQRRGRGLPIGLVADDAAVARSPTTEKRGSVSGGAGPAGGTRAIDCAICREVLEVPVLSAGEEEGRVANVFARRLYMVTPCRHIFHTACLEGWMRFRLQCPICREELPPI
ncbi:hypothetical protein ACCO45_008289 [Purpureocillium lilacinum]|uniref:Uncharacterized protein n=1 Tax=Purpureocillium lilacinum TaxID=33203 RepID=A0ACC4DN78_PURLI